MCVCVRERERERERCTVRMEYLIKQELRIEIHSILMRQTPVD